MTNEQLEKRAADLIRKAEEISHPMLPKSVKAAIQSAALILGELTRREVKRCQEQTTTESR